jgi:hypothetical protein
MKTIIAWLLLSCGTISLGWAGGDHSDHAHADPATVLETSSAVPTLRAESEQFELVARLYEDELGIYIDRWSSNVPLLHAEIEVEANGMKAVAKFHEDHGDYAVSDPGLLKSLHAAGVHSLVFTIIAAVPPQGSQGGKLADKETDLLTGELHVHEADAMTAISKKSGGWLLIGAVAAVIFIGCGLGVYHLLRARKEGSV